MKCIHEKNSFYVGFEKKKKHLVHGLLGYR